jgi:hypothetical protein
MWSEDMSTKSLAEIIRAEYLRGGGRGPVPLTFVRDWRLSHAMYPCWVGLDGRFNSGSSTPVRGQSAFYGAKDAWQDLGHTGECTEEFVRDYEEMREAIKTPEQREKEARVKEEMRAWRAAELARLRAAGLPAYGLDPDYRP